MFSSHLHKETPLKGSVVSERDNLLTTNWCDSAKNEKLFIQFNWESYKHIYIMVFSKIAIIPAELRIGGII